MKNKYAVLLPALLLCLSLAACGGDDGDYYDNETNNGGGDTVVETGGDIVTDDTTADTVADDSPAFDTGILPGTWVGTDGTMLTVEAYSGEGAAFVLLDRYGNWYTDGVIRYEKEDNCLYAIDNVGGDATECWMDENGRLVIPGFSTYSRVTGDASDYIVICGTWYPDGDTSASRCIEFDASGTMWSIYERNADSGLWDGVDGGTLNEISVNRYEAVSNWYDGETFDCYLENGNLYWGSEDSGYEIYG